MKSQKKKVFILDTSVLIFDPKCLLNFKDNDLIIPLVVIEELDGLKVGTEMRNFSAREVTKTIRDIAQSVKGKLISNGGVPIGRGLGKLRVMEFSSHTKTVGLNFDTSKTDNKILSLVHQLSHFNGRNSLAIDYILVTNDVNLQTKAMSLGLKAESYNTDSVDTIETFVEVPKSLNIKEGDRQNFYESKEIGSSEYDVVANQFFYVGKDGSDSMPGVNVENKLIQISRQGLEALSIKPRKGNLEQVCAMWALLDPRIKVMTIVGKAGTGKTIMAIAAGLYHVYIDNKQSSLLFTRNLVSVGKESGFLPGGVNQKISPYIQPFYDNLEEILSIQKKEGKKGLGKYADELENLKSIMQKNPQNGGVHKIEFPMINLLRGRSLNGKFIIIDEAQNLTPHEIKTIVTRVGHDTKVVFLGDFSQIDTPYLNKYSSGLGYLIQRLSGQDFFAHIALVKGERSNVAEIAAQLL